VSVLIAIVVVGTEGGSKGRIAGSAAARLELPLDVVGCQSKWPRMAHPRTAGKESR
jgi:hypothetical protein